MADLESIRPVVLQQPNGEKLQLELKITQVADDTTAIKSFEKGADISIASFDYATGIAVFFVLCATWFAYWCAQKSFKLTEMSFKTLSDDIRQSAEVHQNTTDLIIKSQFDLKNAEFQEATQREWKLKLIEDFISIKPLITKYFTFLGSVNLIYKGDKEFWINKDLDDYRADFEKVEDSLFQLIAHIEVLLKFVIDDEDNKCVIEWKSLEENLVSYKILCMTGGLDKNEIATCYKNLTHIIEGVFKNLKNSFKKKAA